MTRRFLSLALCLALPCVGSLATAQQPSNWTTLTLPTGVSSLNAIGTTVTFRTGSEIWLYSGITKQWSRIQVSPAATLFQANDYCIVRDGDRFYGFASHTGNVRKVQLDINATVVSGPASSSWVTMVSSGARVWGFAAFHGEWESVRVRSSTPVMVSSRLMGLVDDGVDVYGISAHHGTFVGTPSAAGVVLSVVGEAEVGTAHDAGTFRAFSAQQNRWVTSVVPSTSNSLQQNEYAMVWAGNQVWACSGLTGALTTYTANVPIAGIIGAAGAAAWFDGNQVVCYGSGRGTFAAAPATNPVLVPKYHYVFVQDIGGVLPFSAITGTFGPLLAGSFATQGNDAIGYADDGQQAYAYSPILNTWTAAPAVTATNVTLVRDAVVIAHAGGYEALSARYGTWQSLSTMASGIVTAPISGATFLVNGGNGDTLHVFDARLNRWAAVTGQGPMTVRVSRHTAMAHDGQFGYGFGQPSGEWSIEPLSAPPTSFDTASSIGTLVHGNQVSVYSVQGSLSYTGRYPEFTQAINLGNTLRMHQVAPAGSLLLMLVGSAPAYDLVPPFGRLYIDQAGLSAFVWPQLVDADGLLDLEVPMPQNPALVGLQLHLQNLVVPPVGPPWLSSSVAPILF